MTVSYNRILRVLKYEGKLFINNVRRDGQKFVLYYIVYCLSNIIFILHDRRQQDKNYKIMRLSATARRLKNPNFLNKIPC